MSTLQFQLRQRRASLRRMLFLLHYLKTIATALMEYLIFLAKTSAEIAAFLISSQMNLQQNYKKKIPFRYMEHWCYTCYGRLNIKLNSVINNHRSQRFYAG